MKITREQLQELFPSLDEESINRLHARTLNRDPLEVVGSKTRELRYSVSQRALVAAQLIRFAESQREISGSIYFVQSGGAEGPVKIGTAIDVHARLRELQVGNPHPLRLLGTMRGDRIVERGLHRRFASSRLRGEWFAATSTLLGFIAEYAS